jgi:hypothetical protein
MRRTTTVRCTCSSLAARYSSDSRIMQFQGCAATDRAQLDLLFAHSIASRFVAIRSERHFGVDGVARAAYTDGENLVNARARRCRNRLNPQLAATVCYWA